MNARHPSAPKELPSSDGLDRLSVIRSTERSIGLRLLSWSVLSILAGAALLTGVAGPFGAGIGVQALAWGIIDAAIAGVGLRGSSRGSDDAYIRRARLVRLLGVNTVLDVLYVAAGIALWRVFPDNAFLSGNGVGIIIQGGFLFVFDLLHMIGVQSRHL